MTVQTSTGTFAAVRPGSGDDPIHGLGRARADVGAEAAAIVTRGGGPTRADLRRSDCDDGPLEIVALTGTPDPEGRNLHATVSDAAGRVTVGHPVRTTPEIVRPALDDLAFARAPCPRSGYSEPTITRCGP